MIYPYPTFSDDISVVDRYYLYVITMKKLLYGDTENGICDQYKVGLLEDMGAYSKNQLVHVMSNTFPKPYS